MGRITPSPADAAQPAIYLDGSGVPGVYEFASPAPDAVPPRRVFLLGLLAQADGPTYDELVRAVAEEFPQGWHIKVGILAARAVRALLWDELAVTEADESVWLTPAGWAALADLAGRRSA